MNDLANGESLNSYFKRSFEMTGKRYYKRNYPNIVFAKVSLKHYQPRKFGYLTWIVDESVHGFGLLDARLFAKQDSIIVCSDTVKLLGHLVNRNSRTERHAAVLNLLGKIRQEF